MMYLNERNFKVTTYFAESGRSTGFEKIYLAATYDVAIQKYLKENPNRDGLIIMSIEV